MNIKQISRFRAMYIAAMAVIIIGIFGIFIVPRAHAQAIDAGDIRSQAGKYVLKVTKSHLHPKVISLLFLHF